MNPYEITAGVAALANMIASHLSEKELTMLIVILIQLKDNLSAINVQRAIMEKHSKSQEKEPPC